MSMYSLQQLKTENGIIRTKSLFYELSYDSPEYALFTLKEEDIVKWRREAEVKRKSLAFESVVKEIQEGGRSSFTAAKFLINEEWKAKEDGRAARKEKNLKDKTTSEEAFERAGVNEDLKRLKDQGLIN
jgi:hypothetical protein